MITRRCCRSSTSASATSSVVYHLPMILLAAGLLLASIHVASGLQHHGAAVPLRSGTLTGDSVLPPVHRKDLRWAQAAEALREHHSSARRGLQNSEAGCDLPPVRWWKGKRATQIIASFDSGSSSLTNQGVVEAALGGRGEIADFLTGDRYLAVVEIDHAPTFEERVRAAAPTALVAPFRAERRLSPEMAALVEVLGASAVTTEFGRGDRPTAEVFEILRDTSLQVMSKGASTPSSLSRNATAVVMRPTKAMDVRIKNSVTNETIDFFSAAVDESDRFLVSLSTPSAEGLEGAAIRAALRDFTSTCCGAARDPDAPPCALEQPRDDLERRYEGNRGERRHLGFKIAIPRANFRHDVTVLAALPFVNWIEPELEVRVFNHIASTVLQIGDKGEGMDDSNPAKRPYWAVGLDGEGEIVGVGDTGLDTKSCFFWDPEHDVGYDHNKVIGYRGFADYEDTSGHGTHVCGSIAGRASNDSGFESFNGMAPGSRLAFTDLGLSYGDQRGLIAPETMEEYYEYAYGLGARIHSDSWGGLSTAYTRSAREVDEYHFYHPEFLAMIAAGNDGEFLSSDGVESTVSTPATCKNALAVGATLSMGYVSAPADPVTNFEIASPAKFAKRKFQLVSALFTPVFEFGSDETVSLVITEQPRLCQDLTMEEKERVNGKVVLVERGDCFFLDKVQRVKDAGGIGAIIYNNEESGSGFFKMASSENGLSVDIPAAAVPMSTGRLLTEAIKSSEDLPKRNASASPSASIRFLSRSQDSSPSYESIAEYSSFGPTLDGRVKPDVVAPGEEIKSATSVGSENTCKTERISGTSMATPLVAGIAAIVRQYLTGGYYPTGERGLTKVEATPTGSLIKGIIINGAAELQGFAQSGLPLEPSPSFRQGWGRVELDTSLPLPGSGRALQFADWKDLKSTGDVHVYCLRTPKRLEGKDGNTNATMVENDEETRALSQITITLNWMDAPGALSGGGYLVNDLDMDISTPLGAPDVSWGAAMRPDRINNVEKATIDYPRFNSVYTVTVTAHQIKWPMGNGRGQLYSLVAFGPEGFELSEDCAGTVVRDGAEEEVVQVAAAASTDIAEEMLNLKMGEDEAEE